MADDLWDSKAIKVSSGKGFGPWYSIMRWIGRRCTTHFFDEVQVIGGEDVPKDGPFILVCTHFSTIMDVAIISAHLPHRRKIHYWAKLGLYRGKLLAYILQDSGNIQVDRKNKNNQELFKGTFDAMQAGEAIGLFPEGGSYTEPKLHSMKAGAAWAALEYAKYLATEENISATHTKTGVKIVPASINYTEKSRWRSSAVFHMGKAFSVDEYSPEFLSASLVPDDETMRIVSEKSAFPFSAAQTPAAGTPAFLSDTEGGSYFSGASLSAASGAEGTIDLNGLKLRSARGRTRRGEAGAQAAVQKLTDRIARELNAITINAPDWRTWHAMKCARELFWQGKEKEGGSDLPLSEIVPISNALIALFIGDGRSIPTSQALKTMDILVKLQTLQLASRTDLPTLNKIAPSVSRHNYAVPSFSQTLRGLFRNVALLAIKSPLYAPVAVFYAPTWAAGWYMSAKYAKHEEESMASCKSLIGFLAGFATHLLLFLLISAVFLFTPPGLILAFLLSTAVRLVAEKLVISDGYNHVKLIVAYGRLLFLSLGVLNVPSAKHFKGEMNGTEVEVGIMLNAIAEGQPVQWTLTRAFKGVDFNAAGVAIKRRKSRSASRSGGGSGRRSGSAAGSAGAAGAGGIQGMTASHSGNVKSNGSNGATNGTSRTSSSSHHLEGSAISSTPPPLGSPMETPPASASAPVPIRLRRPAPIRLLRLALQTRREAMEELRSLVREVVVVVVKAETEAEAEAEGETGAEAGTEEEEKDSRTKRRQAWKYLESRGARLL